MGRNKYEEGVLSGLQAARALIQSYLLPVDFNCETPKRIHAATSNNLLEFILEDLTRIVIRVSDPESAIPLDLSSSGTGSALFEHFRSPEWGATIRLGSEYAPALGTEKGSAGYSDSGDAPRKRFDLLSGGLSRAKEPKGGTLPDAS